MAYVYLIKKTEFNVKMDRVCGTYYRLKRKLGAGSFGKIYLVEHILTHEQFAAKFEDSDVCSPQLPYEAKLYRKFAGGSHVPQTYWSGTEKRHNILVMDLLGSSLEDLFEKHGKMSLKTVLMLADQMISAIKFIHSKNYIHRDIKPDNFMMGTGKNSGRVYSIDFGLSKRYRDDLTQQHIKYIEGKSLTGTARYASIGALRGHEQSRRDDLEALAYVWVYLLKGKLPWMGINAKTRDEKYQKIADVKENTPIHELCSGLPKEFVEYLKYVRNLEFTETPDYSYLRGLIRQAFQREGYVCDHVYDWTATKSTPHAGRENVAPTPQAKERKRFVPEVSFIPLKNEDKPLRRQIIPDRLLTPKEKRTESAIRAAANEYARPSRASKIPRRYLA